MKKLTLLLTLAAPALAWALQTPELPLQVLMRAQLQPTNAVQLTQNLSLAEVLQTISMHSPDILAAQDIRVRADEQVQQARAAWFGSVDSYALSQHYNDPRLTRPITLPPNVAAYPFSADQFGYGINASLPIDISGQIAADVDVAHAHASAMRWSAQDMRLRIILQGATLYRNLQALAGQSKALNKQLQSLQISTRVAETKLHVGDIARVNLLRLQAAVAAVQAQIAGVDGQERRLRAQLAALMGVASFDAIVSEPDTGPAYYPINHNLISPAIEEAQSVLVANQAKVRSAQRAMLPHFAITGGWNRNAVHWDNLPINTWQINLGVSFNLWSGGAQKRAINAARAEVDQAQQQLQSAQNNLRAARDGATAQWNSQEQSWHAAESGLSAAAESAHVEQDLFKNGLGSATDLIDAEAVLANAHASVATALAGWWQADDALRYAYGASPAALHDTESTLTSTQP